MSLQNRTCMEELFALLGKASAVIYDDDELNEAVNYALHWKMMNSRYYQ